jgi:hypothetical protein
MLPDDDLLSIFDFHVREDEDSKNAIEAWQSLVHVCQRWRSLVFESPRRLNLRLVYTPITPVKDLLDVWPALPLCIHGWGYDLPGYNMVARKNEMIAALKNSDRIRQLIILDCNQWQLREFWAAMQVPFPELTELYLRAPGERASVVPDSFLGGFAPRLRHLKLESIPFPGLPKLLLSATHLVNLHLLYISDSGYISPEAMVTCLSMLTSLSELTLDLESSRQPHPDHESQHLTPPTRTVLPSLKCFTFGGDSKYLDNLVANIDAPQVSDMMICFPKEDFDSPQLVRLIDRTQHLGAPKEACVDLTYFSFMLMFYCSRELYFRTMQVKMEMENGLGSDRPVSDLARACISSLPPFSSSVETLSIRETGSPLSRDDDIVNASWLELLRPFTAVRNLHLSGKCALHIAHALDGDRATEVLPALENIFLSNLEPFGPVPQGIRKFVSARQLTGHSIAVPRMWQYPSYRR